MKIKPLLSAALIFSSMLTYAQTEKCATPLNFRQRVKQNPQLLETRQNIEKIAAKWLKENNLSKADSAIVTIPVVVHVVYNPNTPEQNIADSLIYSQIERLNKDFRKLNDDTIYARSIFDTLAADIQIEFCLANVDPNGNWTNGINRVQSTQSNFFMTPFDNSVKSSSTGGADPWPADSYLNLWVCDMSFGGTPFVLGYAQFPGEDPATDGVVITYQHFGDRPWDSNAAPANKGRTATHEVGHWLGMRHIWGDGACDSTDYVGDTPNADAASQSDCDTTKNTCFDTSSYWASRGIDPPDMVENYMDYSADACMNMFTKGQKARMWSFLNTARASLLNSQGCSGQWNSVNENFISAESVKLFPNPVNNNRTVTLEWPLEHRFNRIELYNQLGELLYSSNFISNIGSFTLNLPNNISKGVYFLKLKSDKSEVSKKIVFH
ncbi:MAG TPA: zinc metalloprotease [Flavobacteriales bacterium]|nr:zinc metalloprotease [Flavobacteriales bacterium]|tara:strand:- start:117318 stop:118628 length:1311 start_codon:yes stop_codon:yes gene_type:complete